MSLEIKSELKRLLKDQSNIFVLFSGIWTFAHRLPLPTKDLPVFIIDSILECIGGEGLLIMPTFTFSFCKSRLFNIETTPSEQGVVSEIFRTQYDTERLSSPINSYCIFGNEKPDFLKSIGKTAWGTGSACDWMIQNNALLINLGIPWRQAFTPIHYSEEKFKVPYRYHKTFKGHIQQQDNISETNETLFVRPKEINLDWNSEIIKDICRNKNLTRKSRLKSFPLECVFAKDLNKTCDDLLSKDKWSFVINKEEVKNWVKNEKQKEIDSMYSES